MSHGTHSTLGNPYEYYMIRIRTQLAPSLSLFLALSLSGCANQSIALPGVRTVAIGFGILGKTNNGNNYVRFIMQQKQKHLHHHDAHHHQSLAATCCNCFKAILDIALIEWHMNPLHSSPLCLSLSVPLCVCHCDVWQRFDSSNSNLVYDSYAKRITHTHTDREAPLMNYICQQMENYNILSLFKAQSCHPHFKQNSSDFNKQNMQQSDCKGHRYWDGVGDRTGYWHWGTSASRELQPQHSTRKCLQQAKEATEKGRESEGERTQLP